VDKKTIVELHENGYRLGGIANMIFRAQVGKDKLSRKECGEHVARVLCDNAKHCEKIQKG